MSTKDIRHVKVPRIQYLLGGTSGALANDGTAQTFTVVGLQAIATTFLARDLIIGEKGVFKNLKVYLAVAPGIGTSRTITLYINEAATPLSVIIAGTDQQGSDITHRVLVKPFDRIVFVSDGGVGTPAASHVKTSIEFTSPR